MLRRSRGSVTARLRAFRAEAARVQRAPGRPWVVVGTGEREGRACRVRVGGVVSAANPGMW